MRDPYAVLGLPAAADDAVIRSRYLELVREFPPDRNPEKFASVREAYEAVRDLDARVRHRLFDRGRREGIDDLIEEMACRMPRRRYSLASLMAMQRKAGR